jgi:hypothetical protein
MNGSQLGGQFTVNNASAIVVIMNCQFVANIVLNAGILSIINTVIYATSSSIYAINSTVNSFIYLSNLNCVNGNDNSEAKLNFIGYWSINNVVFNKTTSNLSLLNLQRIARFDKMDIINSLSITGNINNTTPTQLSYLDATSSIQTQLNNKIALSTNNLFTGIQSFTKPIKFVIPKSDLSNSYNIGIGDDVLAFNTLGVGNIGIGITCIPSSTTASYNIALGTTSLASLTTGNYNIALGDGAGTLNTTASDNIYIGSQAGISNINNQYNNSICLGNNTKSKSNNSIVIGSNTQSTFIDGSLTVAGITSLGNNSTAITQLGSDNSTKIATTAFVKLFSAPIVYKSVKILAPYTFTFGSSNQFNFTFQSAAGTASNNLHLFISPADLGTYNLTVNSTLIYGVTNGTVYNITSTTTVINTSPYLQIGTGLLLGSTDSRGCKGDIYDWASNTYFRFSIMVKNTINVLYVIEQI